MRHRKLGDGQGREERRTSRTVFVIQSRHVTLCVLRESGMKGEFLILWKTPLSPVVLKRKRGKKPYL